MEKNFINRGLIILIPAVAVIIVLVFLSDYGINERTNIIRYLIHGIVMTAAIWLGCMAIVTYLWNKYPWEKLPARHLLLEIILITVYTLSVSYLIYYTEIRIGAFDRINNSGMEIFITLLITYLITAVYESIFFFLQWKEHFSKSVRLERDNLKARYEVLRAQVNPHFLFNSLNGLASLAEDNKQVVDYVQNLSELLRYSFKSGEQELVPLSEEVDMVSKYIALQQTRFGNSLVVTLNITEASMQFTLPPLVLQMLVENCIKHNVISRSVPLRINVYASGDNLTISNNLNSKKYVGSTGEGLANISGRYKFFTTREVVVEDDGHYFKVTVPLIKLEL